MSRKELSDLVAKKKAAPKKVEVKTKAGGKKTLLTCTNLFPSTAINLPSKCFSTFAMAWSKSFESTMLYLSKVDSVRPRPKIEKAGILASSPVIRLLRLSGIPLRNL
jgi:hypothetical protein